MKDAKGHGSAAHQAGVEALPARGYNVVDIHEALVANRLHNALTPDTSNATQAPKWITYFGKAAKRARAMGG